MTPFKELLNEEAAEAYADRLVGLYPAFGRGVFLGHVVDGLGELELKERVMRFAEGLFWGLPDDYPQAVEILIALAAELKLESLALWPIPFCIERYGLLYPEISLPALKQITPYMSGEFAIRPFIEKYPEETMGVVHEWAVDEDEHVRRLASEGIRPRLPWGSRLYQFMEDPSPVLAVLEKLKDDPSEYVRRSVANNLNDIGKDNPEALLATAERWLEGASKERRWVVRHALRSLFKAGNLEALRLMGFESPKIRIDGVSLAPAVIGMGESFTFAFTVHSESDVAQKLMIDYVVHFVKGNGETRPKVFKLTQKTLKAGESLVIEKSHMIKPITTRKYYAGEHRVEIQVNGVVFEGAGFELRLEE